MTSTILVTGFEPYGGMGRNPAHEAMQAVDGRSIDGVDVAGRSLPVSFASLPGCITALLDEVAPAAVIGLGLYPGEAAIRIERIGINLADCRIPDNDGLKPVDETLSANGPTARPATLPVRAIEQAMLGEGIPARLSTTAGTYLCNACFYGFLEAAETRTPRPLCGFLHVPFLPEQVAGMLAAGCVGQEAERVRADIPSMELGCIVAAVEVAIRETVKALGSSV